MERKYFNTHIERIRAKVGDDMSHAIIHVRSLPRLYVECGC